VFELGDRVTILRDGQNVGTYLLKELTLDDMVEKMIGGQINRKFPNLPEPMKAEALKVKNLVSGDLLSHISLTVRKGEVLGITGLMGAGKTELGRALGGIDRVDSGEIYIHGHSVPFSDPATMIQCGIAYLTEDRKSEGVILDQSIRDNYGLPNIVRLSSKGIVQYKEIDREIDDLMDKLAIKAPGRHTLVGQLSGGNQQKVVLAKWLGAQCKILIFDEPTRGIDIRGRLEVYRIMKELLEQGVAILMLTSDYSEALSMSHRVAVLHHGSIRKIFKRGEAMEDDILRVAIGATA
jgi:ribose transport system ATP-binding protein